MKSFLLAVSFLTLSMSATAKSGELSDRFHQFTVHSDQLIVRYLPGNYLDAADDQLSTDGKTAREVIETLTENHFQPHGIQCHQILGSEEAQTCDIRYKKWTGQGDTEHTYIFKVPFVKGVPVGGDIQGVYLID